MSKNKFIFSICLITATNLFANLENKNTNETIINETPITSTNTLEIKEIEPTFEELISIDLKNELKLNQKLLFTTNKYLRTYYKQNNYLPFWFDEKGIKEVSLTLLDSIKNDPVIEPHATKAFKLEKILDALSNIDKSPENYNKSMIQIDFMLTEIYDRYMRYLSKGTINWRKFQRRLNELKKNDILADWEKFNVKTDSKKLLIEAINKNDLNIAFSQVNFTYPNSDKLISEIDKLEEILENGDYVKIPNFKKSLRVGDKSETIKVLRKRLIQSNDLTSNCVQTIVADEIITNNIQTNETSSQIDQKEKLVSNELKQIDCETIFDEELKEAVISFQKNHGLTPDGVVGPNTRKFLNISAKNKIDQIRLNLERMRWLPRDLGEKFLLVNIPDYKLKMYDKGEVKLDMNVVVGEKKHPTPIFSNEMSYIVLNPYWKIPRRIAQKELIPKLVDNPNYVNEKGIRIHEGWDPNTLPLDANSINWQEYHAYLENKEAIKKDKNVEPIEVSEETLALPALRFIQTPSNNNPLGRMKFMFPNKYSVYMHDTNAKSLFRRTTRAFSHGCIRLAEPKELLKTISKYDSNINITKADEVLQESEKKDIGLKKRIPVHIVYLTSWVDENGKLQFRDDIYKYDRMQKDLIF
jgi:murein L,D-transpeptidase YcbB/YkuD